MIKNIPITIQKRLLSYSSTFYFMYKYTKLQIKIKLRSSSMKEKTRLDQKMVYQPQLFFIKVPHLSIQFLGNIEQLYGNPDAKN